MAILVKQWIAEYLWDVTSLPSSSRNSLAVRQLRYEALSRWRLPEITGFIPVQLLTCCRPLSRRPRILHPYIRYSRRSRPMAFDWTLLPIPHLHLNPPYHLSRLCLPITTILDTTPASTTWRKWSSSFRLVRPAFTDFEIRRWDSLHLSRPLLVLDSFQFLRREFIWHCMAL
ncbi:hypothetical protein C8J56DRAFT_329106 [Mycena floridula]|nr:hypothetical protein C8J56DRAFT_329106 [Mycena floridula]